MSGTTERGLIDAESAGTASVSLLRLRWFREWNEAMRISDAIPVILEEAQRFGLDPSILQLDLKRVDISRIVECVYFLMHGDSVQYVGKTRDLVQRICTHHRIMLGRTYESEERVRNRKWEEVLYVVATAECLSELEHRLIARIEPPTNGRRGIDSSKRVVASIDGNTYISPERKRQNEAKVNGKKDAMLRNARIRRMRDIINELTCIRPIAYEPMVWHVGGCGAIGQLNLSVRATNALENQGVLTVADLRLKSRKELLAIKNIGVGTLAEIESALRSHGIELAT